MFNSNSSSNNHGGSSSGASDFFSFLNPVNWSKFSEPSHNDDPYSISHGNSYSSQQGHPDESHYQSQNHDGFRHGGHDDSGMGMDWTSTPSHYDTDFSHDGLSDGSYHDSTPGSHPSGVGKLVAQFENKEFNPPLPPRPSEQVTNPILNSPSISNPFGAFNSSSINAMGMDQHQPVGSPGAAQSPHGASYFGSFNSFDTSHHQSISSPVSQSIETGFGSFGGQSGVANSAIPSPSSSAAPFGGFHHDATVGTPAAGSNSQAYGSLNSFMATDTRHASISQPSTAAATTPTVPSGTPGFEIWRPPGSEPAAAEPKPSPQRSNPATTPGGGYFRPPVPPKPAFATNNQFILELNPTAKAKGKAPVKPPRPRAPSLASVTTSLNNEIKTEPGTTPIPETPTSAISETMAARRGSTVRGAARSREQVPAEAWESYKPTIRKLYLEDRKPLKEVMAIMAEKYNFQATPKMYKTRFSSWGFVKNNTEDEVKRLLSMKFQRDAEGKVSEFVRNGKIVNLGTYLKRKGVTEYDLVDFERPADLPDHIRCRTPTPPLTREYLTSPDLVRAQELVVGNIRKAFLQCRQSEVETNTQIEWSSMMAWGACSSDLLVEANFYFEAQDADQGGHSLMHAFQVLEGDLLKLSPQGINEVLLGMVRRDPGMMTALCKYLSAYSSTNMDRAHPLRQIFTCLYEVQQKHGAATLSDFLWATFPTIIDELEAIYSRRHPYVARAWVDMAVFYNMSPGPERYPRLVADLRVVLRQLEQSGGNQSIEAIALRCGLAQLHYAVDAQSNVSQQAAIELWDIFQNGKLVNEVRDNRPNVYCYHAPEKVDPWNKRCRRRYDSIAALLEQHIGVKIMPYFEEEFHTAQHIHDAQDSWTSAMGHSDFQDPWAAAMGQHGGSSGWGFI